MLWDTHPPSLFPVPAPTLNTEITEITLTWDHRNNLDLRHLLFPVSLCSFKFCVLITLRPQFPQVPHPVMQPSEGWGQCSVVETGMLADLNCATWRLLLACFSTGLLIQSRLQVNGTMLAEHVHDFYVKYHLLFFFFCHCHMSLPLWTVLSRTGATTV